MSRLAVTLLAVVGLATAAESEWRVAFDGVGPVKIGASVADLSRIIGQPVEIPSAPDEAGCFIVTDSHISGLGFMVTSGHVARVDVDSPSIPTLRGAAVGDSVARIRQLYGPTLEERPHFYHGAPDLYLTYWSSDRQLAVRFETAGGKVARLFSGKAPEVEYVEGCQ
jgi:hypothetical protein